MTVDDPSQFDHALKGISHLSLSVTDLDRSLSFYRDVLGLPVLMEPFQGTAFDGQEAVLLAGRVAVNLQMHRRNEGETFDPVRTGLDHLAFHVSRDESLDRWAGRLRENGITCSDVKKVAYGSMIEFRDPDGIQLEIFARD